MVTFDSPILHCDICRQVVLRDTTPQDCARAHHCEQTECPYRDYFEAQENQTSAQTSAKHKK